MTKFITVIAMLGTTSALAETPYPTPTRDGTERIRRTGTCPTGYVGKGDKCETLHRDTPRAYPKIEGRPLRGRLPTARDRAVPTDLDRSLSAHHRFLLSERLVLVELHPGAARSWNGRQLMSAPTKRPRGKRRYFSAVQSRLSRHC